MEKRYTAHINAVDEMSIAFSDFESQQEAEAWCVGFLDGVRYAALPFPEVYWWSVWSESEQVSFWSASEGYHSI